MKHLYSHHSQIIFSIFFKSKTHSHIDLTPSRKLTVTNLNTPQVFLCIANNHLLELQKNVAENFKMQRKLTIMFEILF